MKFFAERQFRLNASGIMRDLPVCGKLSGFPEESTIPGAIDGKAGCDDSFVPAKRSSKV